MEKNKHYNLSPEYIVRNYSDEIKRGIRKHSKKYLNYYDADLEEDMFQNVMLKILKGCLNNFRGEAALGNYLQYYVTKTVVIDMAKKENRNSSELESNEKESGQPAERMDLVPDTMADHSEEIINRITIVEAIEKELKNMPERRQEIFRLRIKEGKKQKEIADIMGITQSTVSEHWTKIIQQLRSALEKEIPEINEYIGK